ncbi:MAG TPA: replication-relaxation family protein [Blastocatellia bacterium]|nr:replication-relaxation family protein [Blastocatellia bacterium]
MTAKGAILTERDLGVVADLYKYRYLSVSQIQRLHFPSQQTAYRRLRSLISLGLIAKFLAPHVPEHIYHLEQKGAELVASTLGVGLADLKWTRGNKAPKDYYFLRHFLLTNDFRIALTEGCSKSELKLAGFIPEYFGEKVSSGGVVKYIRDVVCDLHDPKVKLSHTPDGVFALTKGSTPALFFLEIDRGTEVISDLEKGVLKCIRFYLDYLLSAGYKRYQQDFSCGEFRGFRALVATSSRQRVLNIREAVRALPHDPRAKRFIWLSEFSLINAQTIFQPLWLSADADDQAIYQNG